MKRLSARLAPGLLLLCAAVAAQSPAPGDAFFERVRMLCGATFEGYATFPDDPEHPLHGRLLIAHVAACEQDEILIPFAVGEDRSRTWRLERSPRGVRLRHDHRHDDGTPDEVTLYGGWADGSGTENSQAFPADDYTAELIPEAATNVWTLSISPDDRQLTYDLTRHGAPRFRAVLTRSR